MSQKASITGTLVLQNETTNTVEASFDLSDMFGAISGLSQGGWRRVVLTDGTPFSIPLEEINPMKGLAIYLESGTGEIEFRHSSNPNAATGTAFLFFGRVTAPNVTRTGADPITVRYLIFS